MSANGTLEMFSPVNLIGTVTGWTFQTGGGEREAFDRAQELGDDGDEILNALTNGKKTATLNFVGALSSGNYSWPEVGAHMNGWHIDQIRITWDRGQIRPKMTITVHKHTSGTMHATCRTYASSLSGSVAAQAFGCPSTFGTAFALDANSVAAMRSATLTITAKHVDEPNGSGGNLMGNNHDGSETLEVELTGKSITYTSTWDRTDGGDDPSNTGATTTSMTFEHHIAHTVAPTT